MPRKVACFMSLRMKHCALTHPELRPRFPGPRDTTQHQALDHGSHPTAGLIQRSFCYK